MSKAQSDIPAGAKSAGRPKASEVEARTQELIEAAGCLFLRHGYTKVSLETVAREARVAVRTIYVKFGGKAGLLRAVLASRRERLFAGRSMDADTRPLREIVDDFARDFYEMIVEPDAMAMQRVVIAEAVSNPELAEAFYEGGPRLTRETLYRFFARPDIRSQLRDEVPLDLVPTHLIGCICGDPIGRFLFPDAEPMSEEARRQLAARLELFYSSVLKNPQAS
ncbi:TetR/AcrR family transcriptional regulator [Massilia sp. HP4]|uniref:TetR/AcrR family transcriptional regulator n=1 Tax=Massilia sp. HP4 TaxID=2562316 RepID=UPI0010C11447|nr:TetR/AcrR family transcriptional regulator [Massilia sp. HP4]